MTTLKPFNNCDWNAFAGCESSEPLIAHFDNDGETTVIVDDERIDVYVTHDSGDFEFTQFWTSVELSSPREAERVAQTLLNAFDVMGGRAFNVLWQSIHRSTPKAV